MAEPKTAAKKAAKQKPVEHPLMGDVVNYVPVVNSTENNNGATVVPAMVVNALSNDERFSNNEVNLKVFTDGEATTWLKSVAHSAEKTEGTWHWPQ